MNIGDSVTTIGSYAFAYCNSLTSVTIGDSVTTIGSYAFAYCNSLTSVTIGDSVTTIGIYAFQYCDSLKEFTGKFAEDNGRILVVDGVLTAFAPAGITEYNIPDSVTTIGYSAFSSCDSLTSVNIPDSVTTIGNYAFSGCDSLTSVNIGDSVTSIGNRAFSWCTSLTEFTGKFAEDNGRILVVDGVLTAFAPAGITEYNIPDSVTTIGYESFYDCDSLTSVTIGDSVTSIGDYAFSECDSLTSVNIPDSVTEFGWEAFSECDSLTSVYYKATTPPSLTVFVFVNPGWGFKIYVPAESVDAYKSSEGWSQYASYIVGYDFENGVVVE